MLTETSLTTDWGSYQPCWLPRIQTTRMSHESEQYLTNPSLDCSTRLGGQMHSLSPLSSSLALLQATLWHAPTKCHRCTFLPRIHRVLPLLYIKLLAHCLPPDTTNTEKHPIPLGLNMHTCLWTPQITNVLKTHTLTTWLHKSLLSYHRCLSLQCGCHTFTGGRTQPQNPKTHALSSCILLKHVHADWKILWHLQSLKKPSQCLAILESLTWNKSNKLDNILKIIYIIV